MLSIWFNCCMELSQHQSNPERISKVKPFIAKYNWEGIEFPSYKKDCKSFELNNKSIALNIYYVPHNTQEIRHAYKSKYNLDCENWLIFLTITDGKKWHYLGVKSLSILFRGITSNHKGDFVVIIAPIHLEQTLNLKNMKMYVEIIIVT